MSAAGPRSAWPPTIGLTATQRPGRSASAWRTPWTARMGPIEISGLEGAMTIAGAR